MIFPFHFLCWKLVFYLKKTDREILARKWWRYCIHYLLSFISISNIFLRHHHTMSRLDGPEHCIFQNIYLSVFQVNVYYMTRSSYNFVLVIKYPKWPPLQYKCTVVAVILDFWSTPKIYISLKTIKGGFQSNVISSGFPRINNLKYFLNNFS